MFFCVQHSLNECVHKPVKDKIIMATSIPGNVLRACPCILKETTGMIIRFLEGILENYYSEGKDSFKIQSL